MKPVEFFEGTVLKKFTDEKQDLSVETVGMSLITGLYLEIVGQTPSNAAPFEMPFALKKWRSVLRGAC